MNIFLTFCRLLRGQKADAKKFYKAISITPATSKPDVEQQHWQLQQQQHCQLQKQHWQLQIPSNQDSFLTTESHVVIPIAKPSTLIFFLIGKWAKVLILRAVH